ncbi:MAG: ribonuclease H-like domain-containing protein [Spirochaetota bacterium]|nr:MAG: ribonuclease H-like domain-containing protein [Spirochaetota bacterium]
MKRIDIFERTRAGFDRERGRPQKAFTAGLIQLLAEKLGGKIVTEGSSKIVKVQHNINKGYTHGKIPLEGIYTISEPPLKVLFPGFDKMMRHELIQNLLFFDIETTGLSGGAGTNFFLIGMLKVEKEKLVLTQYFLANLSSEPLFLKHVGDHFKPNAVLVSYNGKSFDMNVIKSRFILNGMRLGENPCSENIHLESAQSVHIDLLYPSRRLWRGMFEDFSLGTVEKQACGVRRKKDIPGYRIPEVYSGYLRGITDLEELCMVFVHNKNDVLSLLALLIKQVQTVQSGMSKHSGVDSFNHLCLSDMLLRSDHINEAKRVLGFHGEDVEALKRLGAFSKREGSFDEALGYFRRIAERTKELELYVFSCTEIAKIYEHKLYDLTAALTYTQKAEERLRRSGYLYPEKRYLLNGEIKAVEKRRNRLLQKLQEKRMRGVSQ